MPGDADTWQRCGSISARAGIIDVGMVSPVDRSNAVYGLRGLSAELTGAADQPLSAPLPDGASPDEGRAPEEQLRMVVARLSRGLDLSASAGTDYQPMGRVLVFRPWPARLLHVVGNSPLAGEFRRLITAGAAPGWELHPVPPGRTPLDVLALPLLRRTGSKRFYNILDRHGFAFAEEVAATPDECLLELRNSGPRLTAAVRAVINELGPADNTPSPAGTPNAVCGTGRVAAATPALPPDIAAALQVIAAWAIAERGARTLGDLLTLTPAAAGMPSDVARCFDRLTRFSLRPLAGAAEPDGNLTRLGEALLGETDERRRLILTARTFAPRRRTYDSLAGELGVSRDRVRQLETDALIRLTHASRHHRYAPLRWRAASAAQHGPAVPASADAPPWMPKLLVWLATKTG
jgi:hypothetical protein